MHDNAQSCMIMHCHPSFMHDHSILPIAHIPFPPTTLVSFSGKLNVTQHSQINQIPASSKPWTHMHSHSAFWIQQTKFPLFGLSLLLPQRLLIWNVLHQKMHQQILGVTPGTPEWSGVLLEYSGVPEAHPRIHWCGFYDLWVCSISPKVFLPVGDDDTSIWMAPLQATCGWEDITRKTLMEVLIKWKKVFVGQWIQVQL